MLKRLFLIAAVLLVCGCTEPPVAGGAETAESSCEGYCARQPHIQCVGQWEISGEYPGCNCEFICETQDAVGIPGTDRGENAGETGGSEELSIPAANMENCVGFLYYEPEEGRTISIIGAGWGRPHPGPFVWGFVEKEKGEYDFSATDDWVRAAQEDGIALLATVWPYADWDRKECRNENCEVSYTDIFYPKERGGVFGGIPKNRCMPCDIEAYKEFLRALVERYDGDGVEDMGGLEIPIKHWEILNEPEMASGELTFFMGSAEEYAGLLKESSAAVKGACEDCVVVHGGAMGVSEEALAFWEEVFSLGGADYFDIANIHFINFGDASTLNVKDFKKLMESNGVDKPIWVTEAEFESASGVISSFEGALEAGAEKVFFTRFEIGKDGPPVPGKYSEVYAGIAEKCPG